MELETVKTIGHDERKLKTWRVIAGLLAGLLILGVFYTLFFARQVLLPIFIAILLSFLLSPIVRFLGRYRVPPQLSAALIVFTLVAGVGVGGYQLVDPAMRYVQELPETAHKLSQRAEEVKRTVEEVQRAAEQAGEIASTPERASRPTKVQVESPSFSDLVLSATWQTLLSGLIVVALLYFLLAAEDLFLERFVSSLPTIEDKKRAVLVVRNIERGVGHYLLAFTINNMILAAAVTGALWWLGMPNPLLFGVLAGLFNFVPYAGAVASTVIIGLSAVAAFDTTTAMLAPPLVFLFLTTLEGTLLQPLIVGRQMSMNPVAVFVALIFWSWLWGVPGALLAVPILSVIKAVFEEVPAFKPVAAFIAK